MKKVAILYKTYTPTIDAIKLRLNDFCLDCYDYTPNNLCDYDLVISVGYEGEIPSNSISVHHSLLPAFDSNEPVKEAILAGVKVTGITIFYTKPYRILAQYPVFVHNNTHYDELAKELEYIEQTLYPMVIEKVLKNEPFETQSLMNNSGCAKNCNSCKGCSD